MKDGSKNTFFDDRELVIQNERKKPRFNFEMILPVAALLLSVFGVLMIYSATRFSMPDGATDPMYYFNRQGLWLIASIIAFVVIQFINYKKIQRLWWVFLILLVALLGSVLIFGYEVSGARSWIDLGFSSIQPSEFSKILMVITTSAILAKWPREKMNRVGFKKVMLSLLIAIVSIVLVVLEPDYGTALIFFVTYMGILFLSGANMFYFFGILAASVGGFFAATQTGLIKQYQLDRILVFLKPDIEKQGIGYNLFQSKLAIGSGGLWGKGLFLGKQTNLSYVPAHHTDFIFSVIGEEIGFFGSMFIILILGIVIWRCFFVSARAYNSFGTLIAGGIGFIILTQVVINIGMTIGIMPIIGIPLPFLSYGGSSLLAIFIGLALVENVYLRRDLRKDYEIAYEEFE
jgi:rod shape determining protein RodA